MATHNGKQVGPSSAIGQLLLLSLYLCGHFHKTNEEVRKDVDEKRSLIYVIRTRQKN